MFGIMLKVPSGIFILCNSISFYSDILYSFAMELRNFQFPFLPSLVAVT